MSEKRLYRVRAVEEYATLAASAKDACRFAREVLADSEPTTSAELMVQPDGTTTYPAGWDGRCLVYGAKPADITLDEAVKAERELLQRAALRDGCPSIPSTQPTAEPEPTLASVLDAVRQFAVSAKAKTHAIVAERMFDAMCCGAKAADLPFLATDRPLTLALIDLLFAKIADTREADAIEAADDAETD